MDENITLRKIAGLFSVLAIIADLITIGIYLNNVNIGVVNFNIESAFPSIFIIVVIFIFAMLLFNYSDKGDFIERTIGTFSWVYVILAAMLFAIISKKFIVETNYGVSEYFGYIILIILISGLGFLISSIIDQPLHNFAVLFMLVGLYQTIVWISQFLNPQEIVFNVKFIGNALLLGVVGGFIVFCWKDA